MEKITILVIGGNGYIGQHLVQELVKIGKNVVVISRTLKPHVYEHKNIKYVKGSYHDSNLMEYYLNICDAVVHLAYSAPPGVTENKNLEKILNDSLHDRAFFIQIAKKKKKLLLVSSGGTVYGEANNRLINERENTNPISIYGLMKRVIENYAHIVHINEGLNYVCARPSNAYGGNQPVGTGQGFITAAHEAIKNNKKLVVFGKYGVIRDYIHIVDLAQALVVLLNEGVIAETYNVGTGEGRTNFDVIEKISRLLGKSNNEIFINSEPDRVFDVKRNVLDISKIKSQTNWTPKISFEEGIELVCKYN